MSTAEIPTTAPARIVRSWVASRVILLVVLAAVLLVAGIATYVATYQPLVHGDTAGFTSPGSSTGPGQHAFHVTYRGGQAWALAFTVRNDGPVGVTVTRADLGGGVSMLRPDSVRMWPSNELSNDRLAAFVRFAPFSLGPGAERLIRIQGTLGGCADLSPGTTETVVQVHLGFRIFGVSKDAWMPLGTDVVVAAPAACPQGSA